MRKEIENKGEIINKLSTALNNITNNLLLKNPTVVLNNKNLLPENVPSNDNENVLPPGGDCSIQQIVKDKEDCASIFWLVETYFLKNSSFRLVETDFLSSGNSILSFKALLKFWKFWGNNCF